MMKMESYIDRMGGGTIMDDDWYWELLEEQHAHDVVMIGAEDEQEDVGINEG